MTEQEDVFENRVRFEETDMQGIVFYGNYVTFQDEAVSAFLRQVGYDYGQIRDQGWDLHIINIDLDYREPATFEDVIVNSLRVDAIGESSINWSYTARRKADDVTLVEGNFTHVAVDADTDETVRVPDEFRDAVADFQTVPPER